jgi:hypothetical protein
LAISTSLFVAALAQSGCSGSGKTQGTHDGGGTGGTGSQADAGAPADSATDRPSSVDANPGRDAVDANPGRDAGADGTSLPALAGTCNEAGWCWQYPLPQGNTLRAGWATAANDVWAVGDGGTILHWDGASWTSRRITNVNETFWSIWASGPSDVWLGGDGNGYHWNGSSWTQTGPYRAFSISGTSSSNVWAAVDRGTGVMRFDGTTWRAAVLPTVQSSGCTSVLALGPSDAWIACTQVFHYDGTQYTPFDHSLYQLAGVPGSDVWALDTGTRDLWHWAGQQWSSATVSADDGLQALWARSTNDVWALGRYGSVHHNAGNGWTETRAADPVLRTFLIGAGTTDLWMGGDHGLLFKGDGLSWAPTTDTTASPPVVNSVWGASADVAWAASNSGLLRSQSGHWNLVPGTAGTIFFDVWGSGPNDVWAVGTTGIGGPGVVRHWNGTTLADVPDSTVVQTGAGFIAGSSADNVWFVAEGALNKWDGTRWTTFSFPPDPNNPITDAWTSAGDDVWVVDRGGRVRRWNGTTFPVFRNGTVAVRGIWGAGPNDVWTVGATASHWDGQTWTSMALMPTTSVSDTTIYAIGGAATNDVWAVIPGGYAFHWDGGSWREFDAAVSGIFGSVSVTPDHGVFIGGNGPAILYRAP